MIARKQFEEAGLRAGCALHAPERKRGDPVIEVGKVEHEVLHPQGSPLAHRGGLRGLKVRVPERGLGTPLTREGRHHTQHTEHAPAQQPERTPHEDEVGVVRDERACCTQVNELVRCWRHVAECVHVRHHVVTESALVGGRNFEVDGVEVGAHLRQRLIRNRDAQRLLGFSEREPDATPEAVSHARRPDLKHGLRGVALRQRRGVALGRGHRIQKSVAKVCPPRSQKRRTMPRPE